MIILFSFYSTCKILCNKQLLCSNHILKMSLYNFSVFWGVMTCLATVVFLHQIINCLSRQFFVGYCLLHQTAQWLIKSRMLKIINRNLSQINKQKTAMEKELIACCEVLELFYADWKYFKCCKNIFIINSEHLIFINRSRLQIIFLMNSLYFQKFRVIWKEVEVTRNFNWSQVPYLERRLQDAEVTKKFYIVFYKAR